jgi:hypothetical protein
MAVKKKKKAPVAAKQPAKALAGDDKTLAQLEDMAMKSYGQMGVAQFAAWIPAYFHPYQSCGAEKKNADMGKTGVNLALVGLVQAVVNIIVMALVLAFALPFVGLPITIAGAVMMLIVYPIGTVIFGVLGSLLYYIMAKLLGGKGNFWEQTYCIALVSGGASLMMAPFSVLQIVPLVGWIFGLLGLVVAIYGMISQYRMIRAVHSLSQLRAIAVFLVPAILIIAFVFFVAGVAAIAALGAYGTVLPAQ